MFQRYLICWLILLSAAAYSWPSQRLGFDPFTLSVQLGLLKPLFAVTMFVVGSLLPRDEIQNVIRRWPLVLGGTAIQFSTMPLLAWGIATAMQLEGDLFLGVFMVGAVPGAMASNVLTLTARGNTSYSVSLTTSATLLAPVVVPALLYFVVSDEQLAGIDRLVMAQNAFVDLILTVAGPVVAGHLVSRYFPTWQKSVQVWGPILANLTILWIIAAILNVNRAKVADLTPVILVVLLAVNIVGYLAGNFGGQILKLDSAMRRALTLEVGMQNAGLGAILAEQLFPGRSMVALPTVLYMFGCMATGTLLAQIWSRKPLSSAIETAQKEE